MPSGGGTMPNNQYQMWTPDQWSQAANYYQNFMNTPYSNPDIWNKLAPMATNMAQTGAPVDVSGWYKANLPVYQTAFQDATKQALEQAGMGGTRYSSGTIRNIADMSRRMQENMAQGEFGAWSQAQEAARQRQLSGMGQMYGLGAGQLGGQQNWQQMGLGAAGALGDIGTQYANLPLQVAALQGQLGQSMYGQTMDPWTQALWAALQPTMTQQTYQPNFATDMMGTIGGILPYILMSQGKFNIGGGGGTV